MSVRCRETSAGTEDAGDGLVPDVDASGVEGACEIGSARVVVDGVWVSG